MMNNCLRSLFFSLLLLSGAVSANEPVTLSKSIHTNVSVTGNMTIDKFRALLEQDFKSVIVNRPDEEIGNLVTAKSLQSIAQSHKVELIYQPIVSGQMSTQDIKNFADYYNSLAKPILMVCRSGSRSTQLYNAAKQRGLLNE